MQNVVRAGAALMAIGLISLAAACDVKDPLEGFIIRLDFQPAPTQAALMVVDAATEAPVTGTDITLTFSGPAANRVVDGAGEAITVFRVREGMLGFGILGSPPTPQNPAEFHITAEADGYLPTSQSVVVADSAADPIQLDMVAIANTPAGVAANRGSVQAGGDGTVAQTTSVSSGTHSDGGAPTTSATITVAGGTTVRDASGQPVSGTIQTDVVSFNSQEPAALQAFPGGFDVDVTGGEPGGFVTGGFVAVEMRDGAGRKARTFSEPIEVTIEVDGGTINPITGTPVQDGDTIPSWSYDNDTGEWTREGVTTLRGPNANGHFDGAFQAAHLSWWNLDWFFGGRCRVAQPINILGNDGGAHLQFRLINAVTGQFFRTVYGGQDGRLVFLHAPSNLPMRIEAQTRRGEALGSTTIQNLCAGGTLSISAPPPTTDVTVSVRGRCPGQFEIRPSAAVFMREADQPRWSYAGYIWRGRGLIRSLTLNQQYEVRSGIYLNGEYYRGSTFYTPGVDPTELGFDVELPSDVCS